MKSEEVADGLEFRSWKHLIVVGAQKHKYTKDLDGTSAASELKTVNVIETPLSPAPARDPVSSGRSGKFPIYM
jgi:hypothetical protein